MVTLHILAQGREADGPVVERSTLLARCGMAVSIGWIFPPVHRDYALFVVSPLLAASQEGQSVLDMVSMTGFILKYLRRQALLVLQGS